MAEEQWSDGPPPWMWGCGLALGCLTLLVAGLLLYALFFRDGPAQTPQGTLIVGRELVRDRFEDSNA